MEKKLKKIVNLARNGVAGERETAERIVRKICERENLNFDEVMRGDPELIEGRLKYKGKAEKELAINVIAKFGLVSLDNSTCSVYEKAICWKTTKEKCIDTLNAWDILRRQMRVEIEKIPRAMILRHDLFYVPTEDEKELIRRMKKTNGKPTKKEIERERAASRLAEGLEDVEIYKRLK